MSFTAKRERDKGYGVTGEGSIHPLVCNVLYSTVMVSLQSFQCLMCTLIFTGTEKVSFSNICLAFDVFGCSA